MAEFLRARRASLDPDRAGLVADGLRRVPGLRREEVAVRARVSADYYTRLEQGRERHPSPQVLAAISNALCLDGDERTYLFRLASGEAAVPDRGRAVAPELALLLGQLHDSPALVLGHDLDVLARNEMAELLHQGFSVKDNSARMCFLDEAGRSFYRSWPAVAAGVVGNLRFALGRWPHDERLLNLVDELRGRSTDFDRLWSAQAVQVKRNVAKEFLHPLVGPLDLDYQSFDVRGAEGQQLAVFTAAPGSPSAARLRELKTGRRM
ncbi:helix-turn-helix domain-containing protein [Streptomyces sp. KK5PA1]|uniref:Helix-turn-helix domain-containing protein n=1 Tax=Actinacidiphila acididurans TaxID=2784346 RepID=A0ABS2TUN5_9ACTN|nr:helix-turn-helix domain-containing protein [Actinacidiphila acididurans]